MMDTLTDEPVLTLDQANAWLKTNTANMDALAAVGLTAQFKTHEYSMFGLQASRTHAMLILTNASGLTMFFFYGGPIPFCHECLGALPSFIH